MTKDIVSGIAITTFIVAVSMYIPILGFFCALFIPLPILFYRSKLGRKTGVVIPVFTVIVMVALFGRVTIDMLIFVELLFIGFVLGEFFELNLSIEKTVIYTCGTVVMSSLLGLIFYSSVYSTGIYTLVSEYVAKNLEITISLYKNMGMPEENIHVISNSLDHIQYVLVRIIPALFIASTVFVTWTSLLIAKPIFRAKALFYPEFGQLNLWKAPEPLVWGIIGCGLLLILPVKALKMTGLNGMLVFLTIYFFQGIAIVSFYFEKKRLPRLLRIFLYSLIALQQVLLFLIVGLGFFDMWLNLRRLETDKNETH